MNESQLRDTIRHLAFRKDSLLTFISRPNLIADLQITIIRPWNRNKF